MASWERDHTTDPALKQLAFDIETTQLQQIGRMQGWLGLWGVAADPPGGRHMAWMASPPARTPTPSTAPGGVDSMPGMATSDQLRALRAASGEQMDVLFLQLMLRHHEGGVIMLQYASRARLGAGGAQPRGADAQRADERERVPEAAPRRPRRDADPALMRAVSLCAVRVMRRAGGAPAARPCPTGRGPARPCHGGRGRRVGRQGRTGCAGRSGRCPPLVRPARAATPRPRCRNQAGPSHYRPAAHQARPPHTKRPPHLLCGVRQSVPRCDGQAGVRHRAAAMVAAPRTRDVAIIGVGSTRDPRPRASAADDPVPGAPLLLVDQQQTPALRDHPTIEGPRRPGPAVR